MGRLDIRDQVPRAQPKTRVRNGATVMRDPKAVDGIVVHQMACTLGVGRRLLRKAGGNPILAEALRAQRTACHAAAMRSGLVVLTRPFQSYLWHGNGFNTRSLGLEIEGLYPGLEGEPWTIRRRDRKRITEVTDRVVDAARDALLWMVREGRSIGMPLTWIWAHRQSSPTRRADPGEELWRRVVLEYAVPELGLRTDSSLYLESKARKSSGDGRPIPVEWDDTNGVGSY
jgi:hypothetical protein